MKAIFKKEIQTFFSNAIIYLLMASFLLVNALLLWFFKGYSNIFYTGFATLNNFFNNCVLLFAFIIPALTMKSFADEYENGTIEILKTLPLKHLDIVLGKFFAYLLIIFILLFPSLIFVYSVYQLGNPIGNIDLGSVFSAYLGLLFVATSYIAIGIFSSIFTKNNITSFLLALIINVVLYFGFSALENISESTIFGWNTFSIPQHFNAISRGVISIKDLVYFISLTFVFLGFTKLKLDKYEN